MNMEIKINQTYNSLLRSIRLLRNIIVPPQSVPKVKMSADPCSWIAHDSRIRY